MTRRGIVLAGTVILDIVNIVDHWPAEETVALIERTEHAPGGPPHNAAAGLVKLGAEFPVTVLGAVGDDSHGGIAIAKAEGYGLDMSKVKRVAGAVTSHTLVMSSAKTGKRTFFHQVGVNEHLDPADLLPPDNSAKLYYLGSPGIARNLDETDGWRRLLKAAREMGLKTCLELVTLDPETVRRLVTPCLPHCDYVVVNDLEAEAVTGMTITRDGRLDWTAALAACGRLLDMGTIEMAAIHNPDGAVGMTRAGATAMRGAVRVPPGHIVGSVGAGDAFYAGVLFGLHEDWPLADCLDLGNAAAATSLHSAATSAAIRPWRDCLAYAREHGLHHVFVNTNI